ncbi:sigma 54-interacting transcriptional regulator, partial [bacterium]|nr:sigma 54-interacting transcriptional regulator [bacterium]
EAINNVCRSIFHSNICDTGCLLKRSMLLKKTVENQKIYIINKNGERIPLLINASPLYDPKGKLIGGVESFRDISNLEVLRKELEDKYSHYDIITEDPKLLNIISLLPQIANSDTSVLITGDSGTGKELFAKAIHNLSGRKNKPFIPVTLGALPESLMEAELFGYMKGAFTGAYENHMGRFENANSGTLFLDEIGDIPPAMQVKLLRTLQEKTITPLGSNREKKIDIRIISATNKDLKDLMRKNLFREDLYYRINVINIVLPPLRERKFDIPLLATFFMKKKSALLGKEIKSISPEALIMLMNYNFPGNIRELENIIEHSVIMCNVDTILPVHIPISLQDHSFIKPGELLTLENIEKISIKNSLERNEGKVMATCRELGITKDRLRRKRKKYNI